MANHIAEVAQVLGVAIGESFKYRGSRENAGGGTGIGG